MEERIAALANEFFAELKKLYAEHGRELTKIHIIPFDDAAPYVDKELAHKMMVSSFKSNASTIAGEGPVDDNKVGARGDHCVYIPGIGVICI